MIRIGIVGILVFFASTLMAIEPTITTENRLSALEARVDQLTYELGMLRQDGGAKSPITTGYHLRIFNPTVTHFEVIYVYVNLDDPVVPTVSPWSYVGCAVGQNDGLYFRGYRFRPLVGRDLFLGEYIEPRYNFDTHDWSVYYGNGVILGVLPKLSAGSSLAIGVGNHGVTELLTRAEFLVQLSL